jgi:digeranylgeranylglycerophospholipid reductase
MMAEDEDNVAVLGGGVSGLATAEGFHALDGVGSVQVFERQSYDQKRVNCGEAINDADLIPLEKTEANGFRTDVDGFELQVFADRSEDNLPLEVARFPCESGYITERDTVERRWANRLTEAGVQITTGENIWYRCPHRVTEVSLTTSLDGLGLQAVNSH